MDFNIQYPTLVEQSYEFMKQLKPSVTKQEVYLLLVENNMIDEDGHPTEFAIENHLVDVEKVPKLTPEQQKDQDIQQVFKYMRKENFKDADDPEDCYIEAKPLISAIKKALVDGSLSEDGRSKWSKVLKDLEQSLNGK
ncbi:hypothetical protein [Lactobacillus acetotolerans]|jgi:hypothetical protein|uniref:hypothetical protein n=1 Tax=Lactobacillus acetotolerans TaxID=1600 RepID=UPI00241DFBFD|nr:hypothetical protein [Lactobacillus acetotolerans]